METQHIGAVNTWRLLGHKAEELSDSALGRIMEKLGATIDECRDPDLAAELHRAIRLVEEELEARCA